MQVIDHRLTGVRQVASPNQDARPDGEPISLIVIHCISLPPGEFGGEGVTQLFTNRLNPDEHPYYATIHALRVSAHLLIRRSGELIQYVPFDRRAWHAGASCYAGRSACNDFSIGIELEGTEDQPYETRQYQCLNAVIDTLMTAYPALSRERITGHEQIAPGRKRDPGPGFEWSKIGLCSP